MILNNSDIFCHKVLYLKRKKNNNNNIQTLFVCVLSPFEKHQTPFIKPTVNPVKSLNLINLHKIPIQYNL